MQLADGAVHGCLIEPGPGQEAPGAAEAGDSSPHGTALVPDDHDAVGVAERALALPVGIAGETTVGLAAQDRRAAVRSDAGVGFEGSGEAPDLLPAHVAESG